jgi:ParB-like chromosome segregation protein Spo0J
MTSKLEPHPLSALFPPISEGDFDKLAADIKLHGLHQPIVLYQGKILDGNNRYRACEDAKIAPRFTDFDGDDAKARNYVISANIHRRHLDRETRTKIVAELLKADPTQSNRQYVILKNGKFYKWVSRSDCKSKTHNRSANAPRRSRQDHRGDDRQRAFRRSQAQRE